MLSMSWTARIPALLKIVLKHFYSRKDYPEKLRRIKYYDKETSACYIYLTNNFDIPA